MCGRLNFSMYGTRKAAINWQQHYTNVLLKLGFKVGCSNPCIIYHACRNIYTMVHGDDFASTAEDEDLLWLKNGLEKDFLLKTDIIGLREGQKRDVKILNRIIRFTPSCIEYEADPRHSEIIIKQLGLTDAKPLTSPCTDEEPKLESDNELLTPDYSTQYKSITMTASYLSHDRADLQFAVKRRTADVSTNSEGLATIEETWQICAW